MAFSLKDYTNIEKIGEGGQGKVYRAVQTALKRKVVIKEMTVGTVESREQLNWLEEEATAAASLEHDNIVRLYDFGYDHGRFYLVMEYVEGFDLSRLLPLKKFPRELGLMVMLLALKGLHYAHRQGVIHCDFKPNNILVSKSGRVTVTDFGMVYPDTKSVRLTARGSIYLTPAFMPPELAVEIEGQGQVKDLFSETSLIATAAAAAERIRKPDARRDIWSTGVILYRILSGNFPFTGTSVAGLVDAILHVKEPPIEEAAPFLPADLAENIGLCLRKDRDKRLSRLDPLIESLEKLFREMNILDCEEEIGSYFEDPGRALDRLDTLLAAYHLQKSFQYKKSGNTRKLAAHFHEAEKHGFSAKSDTRAARAARTARVAGMLPLFTAAIVAWTRSLKSPVVIAAAAMIAIAVGVAAMKTVLSHPVARKVFSRNTAQAVAVRPAAPIVSAAPAAVPAAPTDTARPVDTQESSAAEDAATADSAADTPRTAGAPAPAAAATDLFGTFKVAVTPATAQVYADEKPILTGEIAEGKRLKAGTHYITVVADGYEPYWSSLDVPANMTRTLTIALSPVPENHGYLQVYSSPRSTVYVDGIFRGTTESMLTLALKQGDHVVTLRRSGYRAFSRTVAIAADSAVKLTPSLVKEE
jgi:serine/threonine-protein kinase